MSRRTGRVGNDAAVDTVPLRGRLLVAAPPLVDPNFDRTVVLVLEHGEEGSLGLVLNRPGNVELEEALPEWLAFAAAPQVVFAGGPVSTEAVIALALGDTTEGGDGWVPIIGNLGTIDLARRPSEVPARIDALRVFVGYAGWAPGQLEGELDRAAWFVVDFDVEDAFTPEPDELWRRVLRRQVGRIAIFANCPEDPGTN
jgi:putative transcriptional regulator